MNREAPESDALQILKRAVLEKSVPLHRYSFWYYAGGLTLFAFVIQFVTGLLLLYYFEPGAGTSAASLKLIVRHVPFGWFVRSLHGWSASLAILLTAVHMFAVYFLGSYRGRRASLWWTGLPMLVIMLAFGYTGSLLPQVQGAALRSYYARHVAILPLCGLAVVAVHLLLSSVRGNAIPRGVHVKAERRFFPDYLLGEVILWLCVLAAVLALAWFLPWEFNGSFYAPREALQLNLPGNWYLLWQSGWLDRLPIGWYWLAVTVILVVIAWIPRLDKGSRPKLFRTIGVVVLLSLIVISCLAYFSSPADFTTSAISQQQPGGASEKLR